MSYLDDIALVYARGCSPDLCRSIGCKQWKYLSSLRCNSTTYCTVVWKSFSSPISQSHAFINNNIVYSRFECKQYGQNYVTVLSKIFSRSRFYLQCHSTHFISFNISFIILSKRSFYKLLSVNVCM